MAEQIQGDVLPVYEPVITIAEDGEVLTQAQIKDTALALANRIEFVKQSIPQFTDFPEKLVIVTDDFLHVQTGSKTSADTGIFHGDTPWFMTVTGDIRLQNEGSIGSDNPGVLVVDSTAGSGGTVNFSKFASSAIKGCAGSSFYRAVCKVRPLDPDAAAQKFEFGFQTTGGGVGIDTSNVGALSFLHDFTISNNWLVKTSAAAVSSRTVVDTGVPVTTSMKKLEIRTLFTPTFVGWDFLIDDVQVVQRLVGDGSFQPHSVNDKMQFRMAFQVPDLTVANEAYQVDFISIKMRADNR